MKLHLATIETEEPRLCAANSLVRQHVAVEFDDASEWLEQQAADAVELQKEILDQGITLHEFEDLADLAEWVNKLLGDALEPFIG